MLRIEQSDGWILIGHRDHARLAGEFAQAWGNTDFLPPEPRSDVIVAVTRHDDAWQERDATPCLTREGRPSAFSRELVGTYSAFEEIDLADYLAVRARATEVVATENPYAAILVSMHTVNLLTEQADLRGLADGLLELHRQFVVDQRARQHDLSNSAASARGDEHIQPARLRDAFEFLQACDSLSLLACVDYPLPRPLRHAQRRRDGSKVPLQCTPLGSMTFRVTPYPFARDELQYQVPCRRLDRKTFSSIEDFRVACSAAPVELLGITIVR